ncbi:MAG: hypothetical protein ACRD7E_04305, partial [Bryobacteraceae bacterium]
VTVFGDKLVHGVPLLLSIATAKNNLTGKLERLFGCGYAALGAFEKLAHNGLARPSAPRGLCANPAAALP